MNQNRAKALKEKKDAEQKMIAKDYVGARDKLITAQRLFPDIDSINAMIAACDILSAASIEFPGCEIDYYWLFQLAPKSTLNTITCRYKKLTALLQPIKNKFPGAELALKLIKDAFSVLCDPEKRSQYDMKRSSSREGYGSFNIPSCQSISTKEAVATAPSQAGCNKKSSSHISGGSGGPSKFDKAKDFIALETGQTPFDWNNGGKIGDTDLSTGSINSSETWQPTYSGDSMLLSLEGVAEKRPCQDFYDFENGRNLEHLEAGRIWAFHYRANFDHHSLYARIEFKSKQTVYLTWSKPLPVTVSERRWCDAGLPVACGSFELSSDVSEINVDNWSMVLSHECAWIRGVTKEQFEIYPKKGEIWALFKDWNMESWVYDLDSVKKCKLELVEIMSDFSKYLGGNGACLVKVDGFSSVFQRQKIGGNPVTVHIPPDNLYIFSHRVPAYWFKGREMDDVTDEMIELDQSALPDYMIMDIVTQKESRCGVIAASRYTSVDQLSSLAPLPEDQVLTLNWCSNDFAPGQIWAMYSGIGSVPRQYGKIDSVISDSHVCVSTLEPLPLLDHGIDWQNENLACGDFKVSGEKLILEMSQFSHEVTYQQSSSGPFYKIYPMKGEIWAMYMSWNRKGKQIDLRSQQCQIVLIESDLTHKDEVIVSKLIEVEGCLTFYHRQEMDDGFFLTHAVPRSQLLSFSHRIPAYRVPGIERYGIPESSWHLEPNALPPGCVSGETPCR
ncbi:hypothetical protein L6164_014922 [Bauhinia variegata]|uniref:Uncharacterized protein n=1 Tax=Bauhinia variegata TaxID=167791 RepID=A0ACB9NJ33_BAUVA|nr:hypothetical protein L6164_014922 [Bauhinia variegata]